MPFHLQTVASKAVTPEIVDAPLNRRTYLLFCRMPALVLLLFAILATGCSQKTQPVMKSQAPQQQTSTSASASLSPVANSRDLPQMDSSQAIFRDVAAQAGLRFKHVLGATGRFYAVENTPPGCAFFDFDNDGYLDIFLVQSGPVTAINTGEKRPFCALYHNQRNGTFADVTAGSGFDKDLSYGQGVAVADYDNDGYDDVFVTAYGANHLFRNRKGSGKFEDVTVKMGLATNRHDRYATSAAFGDYDNDGKLDLYICYYVKWAPETEKECRSRFGNLLDYCSPLMYDPEEHEVYHNDGPRFINVTAKSRINAVKARGLAVAFVDYNSDGKQDIFVANDVSRNMMWRNNGDGTFTDVAIESGSAYGDDGEAMAGMGVAIADYDHDGREDLYVSNYSERPNILFRNLGGGLFQDESESADLVQSHFNFLTFGCEFLDYDADGWSDILINNGHVLIHQARRDSAITYRQRKQLLRNMGTGQFVEVTDMAKLGALAKKVVGRGLATGDFDNDGRIDALASNQDEVPQLFRNELRNANNWVSFKVIGTKSNRNGLHARITLEASGKKRLATVRAGSSYLSASDRRVYFGLGAAKRIERVTVVWPSGTRDTLSLVKPNAFHTITEGQGITNTILPTGTRVYREVQ
jgi:hypothetical protein